MKKTTILFDLDGTLLPIDEKHFVELYFGHMGRYFAPLGFDPKAFIQNVWIGTKAMKENIGPDSNETLFWKVFRTIQPGLPDNIEEVFLNFYETQFDLVQPSSKRNPLSNQIVQLAKEKGYRIALATNPLFPKIATLKRVSWAGLNPSDFELITTYETSHASKPSKVYYQEIVQLLGVSFEECIMIGNDASEDGITNSFGMDFFLVTDQLINTKQVDLNSFRQGSLEGLYDFIQSLPHLS